MPTRLLRAGTRLIIFALAVPVLAQESRLIEWPYWGGNAANARHATIPDITPANVHQLEKAWEWNAGEQPNAEYGTRPGPFEATPMMLDNVLYLTTPCKRVVALDAGTGRRHGSPARLRRSPA